MHDRVLRQLCVNDHLTMLLTYLSAGTCTLVKDIEICQNMSLKPAPNLSTVKVLKLGFWFYNTKRSKNANEISNSVDPDPQSALGLLRPICSNI